jgi:hypothetical protein
MRPRLKTRQHHGVSKEVLDTTDRIEPTRPQAQPIFFSFFVLLFSSLLLLFIMMVLLCGQAHTGTGGCSTQLILSVFASLFLFSSYIVHALVFNQKSVGNSEYVNIASIGYVSPTDDGPDDGRN